MSALHAGLLELAQVHRGRIEAARLELVASQLKSCAALDSLLLGPLRPQLASAQDEAGRRRLHRAMSELAEQLVWRLQRGLLERLHQELLATRRLAITCQVCTGSQGFLADLEALAAELEAEAAGPPERASTRLLARLGLLAACDQLLEPDPLPAFQAALQLDREAALSAHARVEFGRLHGLLDQHLEPA